MCVTASAGLVRHLRIAYGIRVLTTEFLHGGEHSREVWRVSDGRLSYVAKVVAQQQRAAEAAQLAEWLVRHGVPAQRTVLDRDGNYETRLGSDYVVVRSWVPGLVVPLGLEITMAHVTALGQTLGRLHAATAAFPSARPRLVPISHSYAARVYSEALRRLDRVAQPREAADNVLRDAVRSRLSWLAEHPFGWESLAGLPHCALHGDFHQGNTAWEAGKRRACVLDLDDCHSGPRLWEFALAAVHSAVASPFESFVGRVNLSKLARFSAAYQQASLLTNAEREALPTLLRHASMTATHAIECRILGQGTCRSSLLIPADAADWAWWPEHAACVGAALTGSGDRCRQHASRP